MKHHRNDTRANVCGHRTREHLGCAAARMARIVQVSDAAWAQPVPPLSRVRVVQDQLAGADGDSAGSTHWQPIAVRASRPR